MIIELYIKLFWCAQFVAGVAVIVGTPMLVEHMYGVRICASQCHTRLGDGADGTGINSDTLRQIKLDSNQNG